VLNNAPGRLPGTIDWDTWHAIIAVCHELDESSPPDHPAVGGRERSIGPADNSAPGSDFNLRGTWEETGLMEQGWEWVRNDGNDVGYMRRPGKDDGISASVGIIKSDVNKWPLFYCFSTSVSEFVAGLTYNRFSVFTTLKHGGDYRAAARDLASRGYGSQVTEAPTPYLGNTHLTLIRAVEGEAGEVALTAAQKERRIFLWMSELTGREQNDKWLWHGYLSRGGITLLSALWKSGKTTLLSHFIKAADGHVSEFLGREIMPCRVLYVTEEHAELWAERRDNLQIGDHVGMICRPFQGRPSPAQWLEFLEHVSKTVIDYRFDLVVFDTISKLWPVREENDAGAVEEALMPVWKVVENGVGLLLIHHNRKSGGEEFTGMRGSGGLPAFCETLIEFSRDQDGDDRTPRRVLKAKGRYSETPEKLLVELTPAGYISHGDPDDPENRAVMTGRTWHDQLMILLPAGQPGFTVDQIHKELSKTNKGLRNQDLIAYLNKKADEGEFEVGGKGVKGNPYRYSLVSLSDNGSQNCGSSPSGVGEEPNTEPNTESGD